MCPSLPLIWISTRFSDSQGSLQSTANQIACSNIHVHVQFNYMTLKWHFEKYLSNGKYSSLTLILMNGILCDPGWTKSSIFLIKV